VYVDHLHFHNPNGFSKFGKFSSALYSWCIQVCGLNSTRIRPSYCSYNCSS